MSKQLTANSLHEEFRKDSRRVLFFGFGATILSALYFALVSANTIWTGIVQESNWIDYAARIPFWCVNAIAVCMVFTKVRTYGRFVTHQMTVFDVLIPFAKAFVASALFFILSTDGNSVWRHWVLVFAAFALVSHLKIHYYLSKLDEANAPPQTATLIRMIKKNTRKSDLRATAIFGLLYFVMWVLLNFVPPLQFMASLSPNWQALLAIPAGFSMIMAIYSDKKIRVEVSRLRQIEGDA